MIGDPNPITIHPYPALSISIAVEEMCWGDTTQLVFDFTPDSGLYEIEYTIEMSLHMPIGDVGDLSGN